jgi:uncharacterized protein (TIGR03118 family)
MLTGPALAAMAAVFVASWIGTAGADKTGGYVETDLVVGGPDATTVKGVPTLTDANGVVHSAQRLDPNLANAWGLTSTPMSQFWVSDNGTGLTTTYVVPSNTPLKANLGTRVVHIPSPSNPFGGGTPTGAAWNPTGGLPASKQEFIIHGVKADCATPTSAPAAFLFATEDGTIVGWNPNVFPKGCTAGPAASPYAIIAVNNSPAAVYKGLAIATDASGTAYLYATNFRAGQVEIYTGPNFTLVTAFTDPSLPDNYAPFNVVPITLKDGTVELVVTFAVQNAAKHDDVAGQSHGIVDTFDLSGDNLQHFAQHGQLDSPWGVALAPDSFGELGGSLLIGNFGNGHINAYDVDSGRFNGKLRDAHGQALVIEGLWALKFGNGAPGLTTPTNGGSTQTLYFTAGPNGENDGLFGALTPAP